MQFAVVPWGVETLIWSDTTGPSSCLSFRTRCFVLKAQYVKNVQYRVKGSPLQRPRYGRSAFTNSANGIFFQRIPAIPVHRNCILGRDPSHQFIHREKENPVVADRVRVELCLRMSLPKSVLVWAELLVKALEAWVLGQVGVLAHAYGRDPSLDVVCSFHSSLLGSMIIDP